MSKPTSGAKEIAGRLASLWEWGLGPKLMVTAAIREAENAALERAAVICEQHAIVHRDNDETTWSALAETYAHEIRALKSSGDNKS